MPLPKPPSFLPPKPQVPLPPSPEMTPIDASLLSIYRAEDWLDGASTLSLPMRRISSTSNVVNLGVGVDGIAIGPGINPNLSTTSTNDGVPTTNNPPIVNTGNNGPMCVQPGDWKCSVCDFVNWRRRKYCMKCFPHLEANEHSEAITKGALLAAQLAAGVGSISTDLASTIQLSPYAPLQIPNTTSMASSTISNATPTINRPFSTLPPRPNLDLRSSSLYKTATTSNWNGTGTGIDQMNPIESDQQLIRALKAQINISTSGSYSMTSSPTTSTDLLPSSIYPPPSHHGISRDTITRSPSVPTLSTNYTGTISPSIRNIWQYGPSSHQSQHRNGGSTITTSSGSNSLSDATITPLTCSSAIAPPTLPPTYRPYNPTTIFGQQAVDSSLESSITPTTTGPYNGDIWRVNKGATFSSSLSQLSGQSSTKNSGKNHSDTSSSSHGGNSSSTSSSPKATSSCLYLEKEQP